MADVRIDDRLAVSFDGKYWWASSPDGVVGRLSWSLTEEERDAPWLDYRIRYPRSGTLAVERLLLNKAGDVVNFTGFVSPG